jgi:hypothetical protein
LAGGLLITTLATPSFLVIVSLFIPSPSARMVE